MYLRAGIRTTESILTDRYVAEALRSLPARQRSDIEAELRTLIADAIGWPEGVAVVPTVVVGVVLLFSALDSIDAIVRATRKRRTR